MADALLGIITGRKDTISNMERKEGKLREIMGSEKGIRAVRRREVKSERQR